MGLNPKIGLIGHPVGHSRSPEIFSHFFDTDALDWEYHLLDIPNLDGLISQLETEDYLGYNVTIPYKQSVLRHVQAPSPRVVRIGAANTLYRLPNGLWAAENTDYDGFLATFNRGILEWNFSPQQAIILGTGGASKAVKAVIEDLNIPCLTISRNPKSGQWNYAELSSSHIENCLLVNCTPVGMHPQVDQSPLNHLNFLKGNAALIDLVYNPAQTKIMEQFESNGFWNTNGELMLQTQAKAAWNLFRSQA